MQSASDTVLLSIRNWRHPHLRIDKWQLRQGEAWCVLGRNGAGKQYVDQLLLGTLKANCTGEVDHRLHPDQRRLVSFEAQQLIYERELKLAANDLLVDQEPGTLAADFLPAGALDHPLLDTLHLRHRLNSPYRLLSTGESRKLLVAQAILAGAQLLILDNPYDSLDPEACHALNHALEGVAQHGVTTVLLLSNRQDVPDWCQRVALIDQGELTDLGQPDDASARDAMDALFSGRHTPQPPWPEDALQLEDYPFDTLVDLRNCRVSFGGRVVFEQLDLRIRPLEHTLVTGDNGSGKSTLLGLITGDCPQCYSNDVTVLGCRRGSGESVWDLKHHMGIVSNDLHRRYRVNCSVEAVVCSGFYDSIGVYDPISDYQQHIAQQWLAAAGLAGRGRERFQSLSYGEQRLVLIARALVKSPLLLILDEPTQGLDELNRRCIMDLLETLNARQHSTVIFVSHRQDEHLPLFHQHLHLVCRD